MDPNHYQEISAAPGAAEGSLANAVQHLSINSVGDRNISEPTSTSQARCNKGETTEPLPNGTNFMDLPLEIRWQIWKDALPYPRIVRRIFFNREYWSSYVDRRHAKPTWDRLTLAEIAPFITCQESWIFFNEHYDKIELTATPHGNRCHPNIYFDFSRDTMELDLCLMAWQDHPDRWGPPERERFFRTSLAKLRNLAVSVFDPKVFTRMEPFDALLKMVRQEFPELKILTLNNARWYEAASRPGRVGATLIDKKFSTAVRNSPRLKLNESPHARSCFDSYFQRAKSIQLLATKMQCKDLEIQVCAIGFYEPWGERFARKYLHACLSLHPF